MIYDMNEEPSLELIEKKKTAQTRISKPPCKQRCSNPIIFEERIESENDIVDSRIDNCLDKPDILKKVMAFS